MPSKRNRGLRRWTNAAKDCYLRNCVCRDCYYHAFFNSSPYQCKMKMSVIRLVEEIGLHNDLIDTFGVKENE